jgi:hypothetical protein
LRAKIAARVLTGSDLRDLGHSCNHFNKIVAAISAWIDRQTATFLLKPLESTSFPPHFFITADKSSPRRLSNQAVMICPMANGEHTAIPINSPIVYSSKNKDVGNVSGATAGELANQIVHTIKQALHRVLNVDIDPEFSAGVWDPSHWINLAILDIRDDKLGSSSTFLRSLINHSKNIHTMFGRGKMLSSAIANFFSVDSRTPH